MTLAVTLVTRGSPDQLTGGHLYHRRMAERAAARQATISFVDTRRFEDPLKRSGDVAVIDSITAWSVSPWLARRRLVGRRPTMPVAAILHQPPGGVAIGGLRRMWQRPLDRAAYGRCRLLIATSDALAVALVRDHGLPAHVVTVIEPGSDLPGCDALAEMRSGHRVALLCVANWLPNKGLLELLDAVAGLAPGDATLHLVGRDDVDVAYTRQVRARLSRRDLVGRVVLHGVVSRDDIGRLYRGADAFVLASVHETYGTVHAEALTAGLPTIGWSSGNLRHLIEDGREGVLVRRGDIAGLRSALARVATDDGWRAELTAAARRRGSRLPTWDTAADSFFAALRGLASRRSAHSPIQDHG